MNQAQNMMADLGKVLSAKYFINDKLKVCSTRDGTRDIWNKIVEETKNEKDNTRLRELNSATLPASTLRYYFVKIFGGYKTV